jgi:hypothetical protein
MSRLISMLFAQEPRWSFTTVHIYPRGGALRGELPEGPIWALRGCLGPPGAYSIQVIYSHIWTDRLNFVILRDLVKMGNFRRAKNFPRAQGYNKSIFSSTEKIPGNYRVILGYF